MNINPSYQNKHIVNSCEVMADIQGIIYDMLIEPMQEKLNDHELNLLSKIAEVLESVAEKATAYEQLNKGTLNKNYRN